MVLDSGGVGVGVGDGDDGVLRLQSEAFLLTMVEDVTMVEQVTHNGWGHNGWGYSC